MDIPLTLLMRRLVWLVVEGARLREAFITRFQQCIDANRTGTYWFRNLPESTQRAWFKDRDRWFMDTAPIAKTTRIHMENTRLLTAVVLPEEGMFIGSGPLVGLTYTELYEQVRQTYKELREHGAYYSSFPQSMVNDDTIGAELRATCVVGIPCGTLVHLPANPKEKNVPKLIFATMNSTGLQFTTSAGEIQKRQNILFYHSAGDIKARLEIRHSELTVRLSSHPDLSDIDDAIGNSRDARQWPAFRTRLPDRG
jgi:hypothetical protein